MAHASQERYSALVDAKLRATLVTRDNTIFNNRYEGSPKAGKVKIPVRDTEVAVKAYDKANGVDADVADAVTEKNLESSIKFVKDFAKKTNAVIAVTGAIDLVSDGEQCAVIRNGRAEMGKITGTGCQLSGMTTAFAVANQDCIFTAVTAAVCAMGLAGEIAYSMMQKGDGNATYRNRIIDAIYNMDKETLDKGAKYEIR